MVAQEGERPGERAAALPPCPERAADLLHHPVAVEAPPETPALGVGRPVLGPAAHVRPLPGEDVERAAHHEQPVGGHVPVVESVLRDHLPVQGQGVLTGEAQVQVVIGGGRLGGVEPADAQERIPSVQAFGRHPHEVRAQQRGVDVPFDWGLLAKGTRLPVEADDPAESHRTGGLGACFERGQAHPEGLAGEAVVGVEEHDVRAGAEAQAGVAGGGDARVRLPDQPDARVAGHQGRDRLARPVVHDDHLGPAGVLRERAVDRLGEILRLVVAGDHHRDRRFPVTTHGGRPRVRVLRRRPRATRRSRACRTVPRRARPRRRTVWRGRSARPRGAALRPR